LESFFSPASEIKSGKKRPGTIPYLFIECSLNCI